MLAEMKYKSAKRIQENASLKGTSLGLATMLEKMRKRRGKLPN
jgi:hypothetical protein